MQFALTRKRIYGLLRMDFSYQRFPGCGQIRTICVHPDGRGHGFAPQLLGEATSRFRQKGCNSFCANVANGNDRAMKFYNKFGFEEAGRIEGHTIMRKDITVDSILESPYGMK